MNSTTEQGRRGQVSVGIAAILATVFAMSFADAIVKYASATFPLWQIFVVRSLIVIAILSAIAMFTFSHGAYATRWAFVRGLLLSLMYIAIYAAAPVLSLSVIAASLYTAPLFITLMSSVVTREPVSLTRWAAVIVGFLGVIVIVRPGSEAFSFLALIPVGAAFLYAAAAIVTRTKCAGQPAIVLGLALNFSLLAVGMIATVVVFLWAPARAATYPFLLGGWTIMGPREWGLVVLLAILMAAISLGLAKAYQSAPSSTIAAFDYAYLPFAAFWSFVIFGQTPDWATLVGMVLIGGAGLLVVRDGHL